MEYSVYILTILSVITLIVLTFSIYVHIEAYRKVKFKSYGVVLTRGHLLEHITLMIFTFITGVTAILSIDKQDLNETTTILASIGCIISSKIILHLNEEIYNKEEYYVEHKTESKKEK